MAQINKPTNFFNTVLYTGDGNASQAITGVGHQPDLTWIKARNAGNAHVLQDVVRGISGSKYRFLQSQATDAEGTSSDYDGVSSLDTDGFTVGYSNSGGWNENAVTYCAWNWLGGGTASSNTDGSVTSTVSANTTSGFSICGYTGTGSALTFGHGLGSAPAMVITKDRTTGSTHWVVYHHKASATPETSYLYLSATSAVATSANFYGTNPTSSVVYIGTHPDINTSGNEYISFCFSEVKSFSKISTYVGNGSTNGTFVNTMMKPAWVMTKRIDSSSNGHWSIFDNKRNPHNVGSNSLRANSSQTVSDYGTYAIDFLSNGFKLRGTNTHNDSGGTYIYMAFAEAPIVGSNNIPSTAR